MRLKKISNRSLLWFVAALLFAVAAIGKTLSGDSSLFIMVLTWLAAILMAIKGYRVSVEKSEG